MTIFRQHKKYLFYLVFPAVCFLFYNSAINIHSHKSNGNIITHAHPFSKTTENQTPFQNHKHTSLELFFFDKIFFLFSTLVCSLALIQIFLSIILQARIKTPGFSLQSIFTPFDNSRAPPL